MQIYDQIRVVLLSGCWSGDQQQLKTDVTNKNWGYTNKNWSLL